MRISTTGLNGNRKPQLEEPVQSQRTVIENQVQRVVTENAQINGSRPHIAWIDAAAPGEIEVLDFLSSLIRMLKPAEAVAAGIDLGTASVAIGSALRANRFGRLTSRIADPAAARFGMARIAAADLADWVKIVTDEGLDESTGFQFALFDPDIHPRSLEFNRIYQRLALGATVVFRAKIDQGPDAADAIGELIAEGRLAGSFIQRCGVVFVGSVRHCPASQTPRSAAAPVPKRKAILVLGVHRSGTSSLAHLLNVLGAKLPEELLGPGHGNPLGHWEPRRLIQINKAILAAIGRNWKDPGPIPRNWFRSKEAYTFHERIAAEITSAYGDSPLILIKEPRICRIAPLYLDVLDGLGIEPLVILLVRNPGEVIESLKERDQLDSNTIELLWLRSLLEAEEATRGCKRVWTSFDQLLGDWRAILQSIATGLDVTWPKDVATIADEAAEIVRP
jgi:predicted O-methyltransferase YrrM